MKAGRSQAKTVNTLKSNTNLPNISCLVSGFDPFNDSYHNPSAAIAEAMPSYLHLRKSALEVSITSIILPTKGDEAWTILKAAIDKLPKGRHAILIMIGQAANRKYISLERFALNFRDYKIKDNAGRTYVAQTIDERAATALRTKAPIEEALRYLKGKGVPVEASNHAGTFVCNEIYFQALCYIQQLNVPHMIYFVHVPLPRVYGKSLAASKLVRWYKLSSGKKNQIAAMTEAIKMLIQFSAEKIEKK